MQVLIAYIDTTVSVVSIAVIRLYSAQNGVGSGTVHWLLSAKW